MRGGSKAIWSAFWYPAGIGIMNGSRSRGLVAGPALVVAWQGKGPYYDAIGHAQSMRSAWT